MSSSCGLTSSKGPRRAHAESAVWSHLVVVVEVGGEPGQHRRRVGVSLDVHVVALEGLHERLGHAIGFGRVRRRVDDEQAGSRSEATGLVGDEGRSVVGEPFDGDLPPEFRTSGKLSG